MNVHGAPGPNGFPIPFYIHFWDVIQSDLTGAVHAFFLGLQLPKAWTATALTLIPKVPNATRIEQLCPISLSNVGHKIISRILNNRLAPILPLIIREEQAGFIKGRSIHANIALAQDMTPDLYKKRC